MFSPVIQRDSSEVGKTTAGAMSSGAPMRPSGVLAAILILAFPSNQKLRGRALGHGVAGATAWPRAFPGGGGVGSAADRTERVDLVAPAELLLRDRLEWAGRVDARVVHADVAPAELHYSHREHAPHVRGLRHVALGGDGVWGTRDGQSSRLPS